MVKFQFLAEIDILIYIIASQITQVVFKMPLVDFKMLKVNLQMPKVNL